MLTGNEHRLEGGRRTRGIRASSPREIPLVTVVTVVMNDCGHLEETIRIVLDQTYGNVEYILIDGGSTDGTLDIVRKYEDRINIWISEPDKGIYDAMNKGVGLASGEWIIFMNSGDRFHDEDLIRRIFSHDFKECDLIYGNHEIRYGVRFSRIHIADKVDNLWKGMIFSHQGVFIRTALVRKKGFNLGNQVGADFELVYGLKMEGVTFCQVDETVASILAGGMSDTERICSIRSHWSVVSAYGTSVGVSVYYLWKIIDAVARYLVKRLLPQRVIDRIARLK